MDRAALAVMSRCMSCDNDDPDPWNEPPRLEFENPVSGDYTLEITRSSEPATGYIGLLCVSEGSQNWHL